MTDRIGQIRKNRNNGKMKNGTTLKSQHEVRNTVERNLYHEP
jgi:hypothetical protein